MNFLELKICNKCKKEKMKFYDFHKRQSSCIKCLKIKNSNKKQTISNPYDHPWSVQKRKEIKNRFKLYGGGENFGCL